MRDLVIEKTEITPSINFNVSKGELTIEGRAYSNDINRFYAELNLWVDEYLQHPQPVTTITLQLDYYNSGFYKLIFVLISKCKTVLTSDKKLVLKWKHLFDDDDSIEDANEISAILDFPIELIPFE